MDIRTAQQDVQTVYLRGSVGQVVSGLIWLASAALATWGSRSSAILALVVGGVFIFPLTSLVIKLLKGTGSLPKGHPFIGLAMQVAFVAPLMLPLILGLTGENPNWFYPAFMIAVGAHYLPFIFLYGMWQYGVLAVLLIGGGMAVRAVAPDVFAAGGWFTGLVLVVFGLVVGLLPAKSPNQAKPQP